MKPEEFCYWLQGFFEISEADEISKKQLEVIKNHLNLVFIHSLDPKAEKESGKSAQLLQEVHDGKPTKPVTYRC